MATVAAIIDASGAKIGAIKFNKAVDSMSKSVDKSGKKMSGFKKILIGTFASAVIFRGMKAFVGILAEQERVNAQLVAGLKSTNRVSGQTFRSIKKVSAEMQDLTRFSNEAVEEIAAIGLSFTNITGDVFPQFLRISADVSTRMGQDLKSSAIQLAKALNDPVANLGALSKSGIQFSKVQKELIKTLYESGQVAAAQAVIMKELETQYGGSAKAARQTLGGAIDGLKNEFANFGKALGSGEFASGLRFAIEGMTDLLKLGKDAKNTFDLEFVEPVGKAVGQFFNPEDPNNTNVTGRGDVNAKLNAISKRNKEIARLAEEDRIGRENYLKLLGQLPEHRANDPMRREQEYIRGVPGLPDKLEEELSAGNEMLLKLRENAASFGRTIANSFEEAIFSGRELGEVLSSLAEDLARIVFRSLVTQPLAAAITSSISTPAGVEDPRVGTGHTFEKGGGVNITNNINSLDPRTAADYVQAANQEIVAKYPRQ